MRTRAIFAASVAVAAALLFVVQPMVARFLLPLVGGSTLVWSTALVFFQASLLGGYLIAHILARLPAQRVGYVVLLGIAGFTTLPFALPDTTPEWANPAPWVLAQLAVMVWAPFALLAAASPLLQRWYSRTSEPDAGEPYWLYSASNAGSIIGLLAYPFVIEPLASLQTQALGWALGFGLLVVLIATCAAQTAAPGQQEPADTTAPGFRRRTWWLVCAAIPASLLVTMTANITADIAPVPLLWVVPLVAYLGTHVWVFSRRAPSPEKSAAVLVALMAPYAALSFFELSKPWWFFAPVAVVMLAVVGVAYHGELVRTRPGARHLTTFYLWTAVGGVLGGAFATFVGPTLFDTLFELPLELVAALLVLPWFRGTPVTKRVVVAGLAFLAVMTVTAGIGEDGWRRLALPAAVASVAVLLHGWDRRAGLVVLAFIALNVTLLQEQVMTTRSAYGRYRIRSVDNELGRFHKLVVGGVSHGAQARDEQLRKLPLSYYHPSGPLGQVMRDPVSAGPIGVIGLGVGSAAAYASEERPVTFFEIDPRVLEIALDTRYFTFLSSCGANCNVEIGDGRRTLAAIPDGVLAVLVVDAFAGDAIPTHLLTVEAFELYRSKLQPGGAILVNGSNMYVDIAAVVANTGAATGLRAVEQDYWPREAHLLDLQVVASEWILLSSDKAVVDRFAEDPRWQRVPDADPERAWTDDWQNLFAHYVWR